MSIEYLKAVLKEAGFVPDKIITLNEFRNQSDECVCELNLTVGKKMYGIGIGVNEDKAKERAVLVLMAKIVNTAI